MPCFDYECPDGHITESVEHWQTQEIPCPECDNLARKIVSIHGQNCANEDAVWIRSVLEVVQKDSEKVHVKRFLAEPTRENYKAWMKGENLRPFDPGERPIKPKGQLDLRRHTDKVMELRYDRRKISLRG